MLSFDETRLVADLEKMEKVKTRLIIQRSRKWLVRGWEKFLPALA